MGHLHATLGLYALDFSDGAERKIEDPSGDRPSETYAALIREAREKLVMSQFEISVTKISRGSPLTDPQLDALRLALPRLLGNLDETTLPPSVRTWPGWVERSSGEILFHEGDLAMRFMR
jgi:hypothetical protein